MNPEPNMPNGLARIGNCLKRDRNEVVPGKIARMPQTADPGLDVEETSGTGVTGPKIRCPKCAWRPKAPDRWMCTQCMYVWNTFDTGGICPGCLYQWKETMCL